MCSIITKYITAKKKVGYYMFNLNEGLFDHLFNGTVPLYVEIPTALIVIVISYLLGSINTAIIVSKGIYNDDIRTKGSGNPGLTNMLRSFGKNAALLTLLGDLLKTVIPICISGVFFGFQYVAWVSVSEMCYVAGLFAVFGHVFPVYYKMKGGKGVLSTACMALTLSPLVFLILFSIFAAIVAVSKYVSLGSVVSAILYPVLMNGYFSLRFELPMPGLSALATIIIAILIVWCHRGNLQRISDRTERKISFKKKKTDESEE